jgi:ABC-2 type transport system permease protein
LFSVFLWLVIDIVQWGFISKYLGAFGQSTFGFLTAILGAIVLWGFLTRIQQGIMTSFLEDIWSQNFINYFASPLKIVEYLSGLVLTSVSTGIIGFVIVVCIAGVGFGYDFFRIGLYLLPFMAILFIFAIAMGIFVSAVIFRLGPTAEWLGWPIPLVLSVFSGVFYPVATLPSVFQVVSRLIPASYVFESLRSVLSVKGPSATLASFLLIGGSLALCYLALAYAFFIKIYRRNLETGAIARFSAES